MARELTIFERTLLAVAPRTALKRIRARTAFEIFSEHRGRRGYDAAKKGRRFSGWVTPSTSASAETATSLAILRNRSRDLTRNNTYAAAAVQEIASNVVGTGIIGRPIGFDSKSTMRANKIAPIWKKWAETTACDFDGRNNLYGLMDLVVRGVVESGEMLIRKVVRQDGGSIPLKLQILEPDHLDHTKTALLDNGGRIVQGVEFDRRGVRVAYWIYPDHPGDSIGRNFTPVRIAASELLHIFRAERAGQIRGVPWGAAAIVKLHDYDEYEDFQIIRQKVSSCFSGFIKTADADLAGALADSSGQLTEKLEPGLLQYLGPGEDIEFANPPTVEGFRDMADISLHAVAAGYGVTYESLTGDYSKVNFSSGRMGWLKFARNVDQWRWLLFIPQFCEPVFEWFTEAAQIAGEKTDGIAAEWTPPRREMIDPTAETAAQIDQVRAGFKSRSAVIRESGDDPALVTAEILSDNEKADSAGMVFDTDPRRVQKSGGLQQQPSAGAAQKGAANA